MSADRDRPDIVIFPPLAFALAILAALGLEYLLPLGLLPAWGGVWSLIGALIAIAAIGLAVWGNRAFKHGKTNVDPRQPALNLVEGGPYRFTRNPMYLGMVIFQIGIALAFSLDWAIPIAAILWAVLHYGVVLREEEYLTARFGGAYEGFMSRTRRWL